MKKILFSFSLFLFYFTCLNVFAVDACTSSEMTRLRELANNVSFTYEHVIDEELDEDEVVNDHYILKVLNLDSDLKLYYKDNDELIEYSAESLAEVEFYSGNYVFYLYSYTANLCTDELLRTITVELPIYNYYYHFNKEKCLEYPDFKYCEEYMNVSDYTFSEIDSMFQEYIDGDNIIDIITNNSYNLYFIIGGVGLIIIVIIFIVLKKNKKKDDI